MPRDDVKDRIRAENFNYVLGLIAGVAIGFAFGFLAGQYWGTG